MVVLKVRLKAKDKEEFAQEAARHHQGQSAYARFILEARKNPALFLKLCHLRDPAFANRLSLGGGGADSSRVVGLEAQVKELTQAKEALARERDQAWSQSANLERHLAQAEARAEALGRQVWDHIRVQEAAYERAVEAGIPWEGIPLLQLPVLKALSARGRLTRPDLERALVQDGLLPSHASHAVTTCAHMGFIQKGADDRYRLAKEPDDE